MNGYSANTSLCVTASVVPSHRHMQHALVYAGDKPPSFVGSRQWIGAVEVSMCLREFYNVESRLLHVSQGKAMNEHARALAEHFETEGTPAMVGGGVKAYTLLGVDVCYSTGDARFLVLDPHYAAPTGGDKLSTIAAKWCRWRKVDFFDANAFFNLCLPIKPELI
mmetsp:Transcript_32560/g.79704  ORF Transcript_32560/g.79704 Transcript_32560/m.79704 type:complete len:165 (-) Transcript_32560:18-512(-)